MSAVCLSSVAGTQVRSRNSFQRSSVKVEQCSTPIRVALSLFSNNNLSQTAPGLSTVTLGS
ncbi:hypothetical protein E4U34_000699 [Claviceps purpurea]|nr:hypothetical protein E4U50_000763 [Claviceps purpurea]KAG6203154.1 hypothetical protein E4U34_000699 [Claviceps purpurea]